MDAFLTAALLYAVFYKPGEKPIAVVLGQGAQAVADDRAQLSSILAHIRVREPQLQLRSRHAEVLVLYAPDEPAENLAKCDRFAIEAVTDLWDQATETAAVERLVEPVLDDRALPPVTRQLEPIPRGYIDARFDEDGQPIKSPIAPVRALCAAGRYNRCRDLLERALAQKPDDALTRFHLGSVLARFLDQAEVGIVHLRRAAELAPDKPQLFSALGAALEGLGQKDEARQAFEREAALVKALDDEAKRQAARLDAYNKRQARVSAVLVAGALVGGQFLGLYLVSNVDNQSIWSVAIVILGMLGGLLFGGVLACILAILLSEYGPQIFGRPEVVVGGGRWTELSISADSPRADR